MSKKGGTRRAQGIHINVSSVAGVVGILISVVTAGAMFGVYRYKIDRVHTTIADLDGAVSFNGLIRKLVEDEVFREGVVDDNHAKAVALEKNLKKVVKALLSTDIGDEHRRILDRMLPEEESTASTTTRTTEPWKARGKPSRAGGQ